ncbi:MAG: PA0069 family radical SAM protein [Limisphaerales bacterium]
MSKQPHRGTLASPKNRFQATEVVRDEEYDDSVDPLPRTEFLPDDSQTIIAYNDSPDLGFNASLNPYRGCEHGCVYCYARPTHEYLGFSQGLDFETKIMVKHDAPELLRRELSARKWKPQTIAMSGVTDCYQPIERKLKLTRACLEVLAECRNPVGIVTKNSMVTRDLDLLKELAEHQAAAVFISLTTLDTKLRSILEPRTSPPAARLRTIRTLAEAGIPVGVMVAPVIPAINDHEIPKLIAAAAEAGATHAAFVAIRLPYANKELFDQWLEEHFPDRKEKVLNQIRSLRDGKLNSSDFGDRMRGTGNIAEQIEQMFTIASRKAGLNRRKLNLSAVSFRRPAGNQLEFF